MGVLEAMLYSSVLTKCYNKYMKKISVINILLFLLLLAGWFYWFEYRPMIIRVNCTEQTRTKIKEYKGDNIVAFINLSYELCLHGKGL
jgi:hypothetical protein